MGDSQHQTRRMYGSKVCTHQLTYIICQSLQCQLFPYCSANIQLQAIRAFFIPSAPKDFLLLHFNTHAHTYISLGRSDGLRRESIETAFITSQASEERLSRGGSGRPGTYTGKGEEIGFMEIY